MSRCTTDGRWVRVSRELTANIIVGRGKCQWWLKSIRCGYSCLDSWRRSGMLPKPFALLHLFPDSMLPVVTNVFSFFFRLCFPSADIRHPRHLMAKCSLRPRIRPVFAICKAPEFKQVICRTHCFRTVSHFTIRTDNALSGYALLTMVYSESTVFWFIRVSWPR